jgi:2-dehydropantoate 2-reductase
VGQVPVLYLLIGNGRLSRHFQHYFRCLDLPFRVWTREQPLDLQGVTHTLLAIPDDAMAEFLQSHPEIHSTIVVHFSGSFVTSLAWGAHPLMTFSHQLYTLADYQAMHFVVDSPAPPFAELLPGLSNPHHRLDPELKARYHAECVLSGNFTSMLWSHFFHIMEQKLGLPRSAAVPYLRRIAANLEAEENPLTGPLVRGDRATVARNLQALEGDPYQGVYSSFVQAYAS